VAAQAAEAEVFKTTVAGRYQPKRNRAAGKTTLTEEATAKATAINTTQ
jgi:hypothetical protein